MTERVQPALPDSSVRIVSNNNNNNSNDNAPPSALSSPSRAATQVDPSVFDALVNEDMVRPSLPDHDPVPLHVQLPPTPPPPTPPPKVPVTPAPSNKRTLPSSSSPPPPRSSREESKTPRSPSPPPREQVDPEEEARKVLLAKQDLIAKLVYLKERGVILPKDPNITMSVDELQTMYYVVTENQKKRHTVGLLLNTLEQGTMWLEWLNLKFDPMGLKLKGLTQDIKQARETFQPPMERIYDQYKHLLGEMNPFVEIAIFYVMIASSRHQINRELERTEEQAQEDARRWEEQARAAQRRDQMFARPPPAAFPKQPPSFHPRPDTVPSIPTMQDLPPIELPTASDGTQLPRSPPPPSPPLPPRTTTPPSPTLSSPRETRTLNLPAGSRGTAKRRGKRVGAVRISRRS